MQARMRGNYTNVAEIYKKTIPECGIIQLL